MKIIASNFTQEQAETYLREVIGKRSAADLFDEYLRGECTEGELRGWLLYTQRGLSVKQKVCSDTCSNSPAAGCWHGLCAKHCRLYHNTNEHSCFPT